jgi:signal transduction histidine kinase
VRSESTLPRLAQIALLAVVVLPFVVDRSRTPFKYGEVVVGLVSMAALVPLLATGSDRVLLWIPGVLLVVDTALGGIRGAVPIGLGAIALTIVAARTLPGLTNPGFVIAAYVVGTLGGVAGRQIVKLITSLHESEERLAREAAHAERRRLAREVHDVIAHSLTITLLQVQGARMMFRTEPENAEAALLLAEKLGRASLDDLRRTVRLLSDSTDPDLGTPVELTADLKRLADSFTAAGVEVRLQTSNGLDDTRPVVAQGIYRIVQEAITNAVRHGPASTIEVWIDVEPHRISMRIENDRDVEAAPTRAGSGHGLRNIIERAAMLGGSVKAGPTKRGWRVSGWVAFEPPPRLDD